MSKPVSSQTTLTPEEQAWLTSEALNERLSRLQQLTPGDWYEPHHTCPPESPRAGRPSGQLQFHLSRHKVRIMAPSNGWGGSRAMACEVDNWARHLSRWGSTPDGPLTMMWFCPKYDQFEILRKDLYEPKCWGAIAKFGASKFGSPQYQWPDGTVLHVGSYEAGWDGFEGVEPDMICFDEPPPKKLWDTLMVRLRTSRPHSGRACCKATQIKGWTWMAEELYLPWLDLHRKRGMDEEAAMVAQLDADYWVWPKGSVWDNPYLEPDYRRFLLRQRFSGPTERRVRTEGGFASFTSDPVFDHEAIDEMRELLQGFEPACESGSFEAAVA